MSRARSMAAREARTAMLPREPAFPRQVGTHSSPLLCVRSEQRSAQYVPFFLAVASSRHLGQSRRTGKAIGMFSQNIVPSSNNLQCGDFRSPTGIVACKDLSGLSSTNVSSCFGNPFSTYSLKGGTTGKRSPGHTGCCCLPGLNLQPKALCQPLNHLPLLRVNQHWPRF